jgi:hypothetical protein
MIRRRWPWMLAGTLRTLQNATHNGDYANPLVMVMGRVTEVSPADEAKIVELVCVAIDAAREQMTTEASWERLERYFYEQMLTGSETLPTRIVLVWAEAGHPAADRAIRRYAATMMDRGRDGELLVQIRAYVIKVLLQPFVPYPQGRHVVQNLMRDAWLPTVVTHVARCTGLPPTRSASTATPSAAYFIAKGMKRSGLKITEREVNRVHWRRNNLAARIEAAMPQIPSTIKEII